jgi:hypothetical protein
MLDPALRSGLHPYPDCPLGRVEGSGFSCFMIC